MLCPAMFVFEGTDFFDHFGGRMIHWDTVNVPGEGFESFRTLRISAHSFAPRSLGGSDACGSERSDFGTQVWGAERPTTVWGNCITGALAPIILDNRKVEV
jgi:hypothetical protein